MSKITKLIRFDWAIKNILRDKANFAILEGFLSELLKQDIKIIELIESESNQETVLDKYNRVDLLVKSQSGELIIIEIQNEVEYDYLQRILYGVSKTISEHLEIGSEYKKIRKVISINIVYFDIGQGTDYVYHGTTNFVGIHNQDKLQLTDEQQKLFIKKEISQIFPEYYILKINKFDNVTKDSLDEWIYFLKTDEVKSNFKAKGLKEAKKKLDVLKMTNDQRIAYNNYIKSLHIKASVAMSQNFDREQAEIAQKEVITKAKKQGIKEGIEKKEIEIVTNMYKKNMDIQSISELTNISIKRIKEILSLE